jgi:hypothetical protein
MLVNLASFGLAVAIAALAAPALAQDALTGVTVEGLVLQRDDVGDENFTQSFTPGGPFVPFDTGDLDENWGGGVRVTLEGRLWGMRLYYGVFGAWSLDADGVRIDPTEDTSATYAEIPGADVFVGNSESLFALRIDHRTNLYGSETGTLTAISPGADFFWGTTSFFLDERLKSVAFDNPEDFNGSGNAIDRVRIESENFMTGLQIGLRGDMPVAPGVMLGGSVRGGLMANFIDVERKFSSDDNSGNRLDNNIDETAFAQFVEARPRVTVALAPGVGLTASGMLLYINGISEATEYYGTVSDNHDRRVHDDGDAFFYGGTLGLNIKLN